ISWIHGGFHVAHGANRLSPNYPVRGEECPGRDKILLVQREESDLVRHLYRLFLAYDGVEARVAAGELDGAERAELVGGLAPAAAACWRGLFGAALETPAHRRLVATWCLRNAELLMKEQV